MLGEPGAPRWALLVLAPALLLALEAVVPRQKTVIGKKPTRGEI